jgi:uncharacterized membrane protein HdeD (DUF308 family)
MATATSTGPSDTSRVNAGFGTASAAPSGSAKTDGMSAALAQNWWLVALRGVFAILFGIIAFAAPGETILSLALLFSAYMLVDGIFAITSAVRAARRGQRWALLVLEGLTNIAVGFIAAIWPGPTVVAFVLLMAAWSVVSGALMLGASFRLKKNHGRGWLALGGAVSIVYGILLGVAPLIGALVLTWWLAAYALVFGITMIALAFQLRARKDDRSSLTTAQPA